MADAKNLPAGTAKTEQALSIPAAITTPPLAIRLSATFLKQ
jgi:hypothetical protein